MGVKSLATKLWITENHFSLRLLNFMMPSFFSRLVENHPANLANICKECHLEFTKNKTIHRKTKTTEGYKLVEQ